MRPGPVTVASGASPRAGLSSANSRTLPECQLLTDCHLTVRIGTSRDPNAKLMTMLPMAASLWNGSSFMPARAVRLGAVGTGKPVGSAFSERAGGDSCPWVHPSIPQRRDTFPSGRPIGLYRHHY